MVQKLELQDYDILVLKSEQKSPYMYTEFLSRSLAKSASGTVSTLSALQNATCVLNC